MYFQHVNGFYILDFFFFFFVYCVCVCLFDSVLACNDGYQFKLLFTDGECLSLIMNFFTGSWLFKKICLLPTQPIFFNFFS